MSHHSVVNYLDELQVVSANLRYVIVWQLQCYGGILGNVGIPDNLRCVSVPAMLLTAPAQFQLAGSSVQ
jgi:hypothetical protein